MLSEPADRTLCLGDEPSADRAMLALQYLTALAAVAAAGLLALIR